MSYCTLNENTAYLKEVGIGADDTDIVTAAEKAKAESYADNLIHEKLGTIFVQVESEYPPAIVDIAEMLASAQLYRFVYAEQLGQGTVESKETSPAWILEQRALDRLKNIKEGGFIVDAAGEFVTGYGAGRGVDSIEESDEDVIFDARAVKPEDLRSAKNAYDWPALTGVDD